MNKCNLCFSPLLSTSEIFCYHCQQHLPFNTSYCSGCATPTSIPLSSCGHCQKNKFAFDSALAVFEYRPPVSSLLVQFKENTLNNPDAFYIWLYSLFYHQYSDIQFDAIIAIPSSTTKTLLRGHTPAETLAHQLHKRTNIPHISQLFRKRIWQPSQKKKSKRARLNTTPFIANQRKLKQLPSEATILLVDDIMTTGASLNHAAKLLKNSGCKAVHCLTLARTPVTQSK